MPIRFGLVGVGCFGRHYLRLLSTMPNVELRATADTAAETQALLLDPKIDAVVISTPATTHGEIIFDALSAGKHVFVEKPMVTTMREADEVKALAEKSGNVFMVGYQYVYHDAIQHIKSNQADVIGNVNYFFGEHFSSGPIRSDAGCFMDAGTHDLSIIQYLFQPGKIIEVKGASLPLNAELDDFTAVSVRFESGLFAHLVTAWIAPEKVRKITIVGSNGSIVLDDRQEKDKLKVFQNESSIIPKIEFREPLRNELEHFIHCVTAGETPITDIQFGYAVTEMCDTILKGLDK